MLEILHAFEFTISKITAKLFLYYIFIFTSYILVIVKYFLVVSFNYLVWIV